MVLVLVLLLKYSWVCKWMLMLWVNSEMLMCGVIGMFWVLCIIFGLIVCRVYLLVLKVVVVWLKLLNGCFGL